MSYITLKNVTFSYPGNAQEIFKVVSLQLDGSWNLGLIGRNGRGKTTLLGLLLGKYPCQGTITSDLSFAYFPYAVRDPHEHTLEVMREHGADAEDWELMREADLLGVDPEALDCPFDTLSHGEQTNVLLAALFAGEQRFLLLDEPTNHVDADGRKKIREYLRREKGFILVSHDRMLLDACIDHVLSINRCGIELQRGDFTSWWGNPQRTQQFERSENEKLKKAIDQLSHAARQSATWSEKVEKSKYGTTNSGSKLDKGFVGHKAAKLMKRSQNVKARMRSTVEEKSGLLKNVETPEPLKMFLLPYVKDSLITGRDISLRYGEHLVASGITFELKEGDRLAVEGANGSGKSTLLHLLCGDAVSHTGFLSVGSQLVISFIPQSTTRVTGTVKTYAEQERIEPRLFLSILHKLGFESDQFGLPLQTMSEGQKKKILIAQSLCTKAHLYVWDEPLNSIDEITRMQIEALLLSCHPTLVFVEHDKMFRHKIATKELRL